MFYRFLTMNKVV